MFKIPDELWEQCFNIFQIDLVQGVKLEARPHGLTEDDTPVYTRTGKVAQKLPFPEDIVRCHAVVQAWGKNVRNFESINGPIAVMTLLIFFRFAIVSTPIKLTQSKEMTNSGGKTWKIAESFSRRMDINKSRLTNLLRRLLQINDKLTYNYFSIL